MKQISPGAERRRKSQKDMNRLRTAQAETIGTIVFDAPVSWGEKVKNVKGVSVVKMFRVTKYVNSPDLLQPWIDHLTALGIKKEIRKDGPPGRSYSLWREGEEIITDRVKYERKYYQRKKEERRGRKGPKQPA